MIRLRLSRPLDKADIQGNILQGYTFPRAAYLLLGVTDPAAARRWLGTLTGRVTTAEPWTHGKPRVTHNVAVTAAGLAALGVPASDRACFGKAFRDGMPRRAHLLGDHGPSDPSNWDAGFEPGRGHVLVSVYAADAGELTRAVGRLREEVDAAALDVVHEQAGRRLPGSVEHFGFHDGFAQPRVAGFGTSPTNEGVLSRWGYYRPLPAGEFLLGHRDLDGVTTPGPPGPLGRNGTYLVYRKLAQDVAGFRRFVRQEAADSGLDPALVEAKLVGRWPDGTPLVLSPDRPDPAITADKSRINAFRYNDDREGFSCPLGAHIRRTNPRDALGFGTAMTRRHRMIRRGIPYGEPLSESGDGPTAARAERGLLFFCLVGDIERQFEFVQTQWCNDGNAFRLGRDADVLVGTGAGRRKMVIHGPRPRVVAPVPSFVTIQGGEYLLVPSLGGLRALAAGAVGG